MERNGYLTDNGIFSNEVNQVSSFGVDNFDCNSRVYLHSVGINKSDGLDVMIVPIVEKEGGSNGSCGVELIHETQFQLHFLIPLDKLIGVVVGSALGNVDGLGLCLIRLEYHPLPLLIAAEDLENGCAAQTVCYFQHKTVLYVLVEIGSHIPLEGSIRHVLFHVRYLLGIHLFQLYALIRSQLLLNGLDDLKFIQTINETLLRYNQICFLNDEL